jgi:transcriptional regulator with XRE-family HTH domain
MAHDSRRVFLSDASPQMTKLARKHLTRQEFGKRLYSLMLAKGIRQADLARATGLSRDSISGYVRARNTPDADSLKRLAKALDVAPEDLLPNITEEAIDLETNPSIEIKASAEDPNRSWVRLNREVSTGTVIKIMQALEEDQPAAKGKR